MECKPKKLQNIQINKTKAQFAKLHCSQNNLIFKYVDCYRIRKEELIRLYLEGKIKFVKKYEDKINKMINI